MLMCSKCRKPVDQCECTGAKEQWQRETLENINAEIWAFDHPEDKLAEYKAKQQPYLQRLRELNYRQNSCEMQEEEWQICRLLADKGYRTDPEFCSVKENRFSITLTFLENYSLDWCAFLAEPFWKYREHRRKFPVDKGPGYEDMGEGKLLLNRRMDYMFAIYLDSYVTRKEYVLSFRLPHSQQAELTGKGIMPKEFFANQKEILQQWIQQLPSLRKAADFCTDHDFTVEDGVLVKYTGTEAHVVIPENVTVIGERAFAGCEKLDTVTMPDTVIRVEPFAFMMCPWLYHVEFSKNLEFIGNGAFMGCESLKNVSLPDGLKALGEGVFQQCSRLLSIRIPETISEIPDSMFSECNALAAIHIPESISRVGEYAFSQCQSLISIEFPEGLDSIGESAFEDCIALKLVKIPRSLKCLENSAFKGCTSLVLIQFSEGAGECLIQTFEDCVALKTQNIPEGTEELYGTFQGCSSLKKIKLPDSLTIVGEKAFSDCDSLEEIVLPESVQEIGEEAFMNCSALRKIKIPATVQMIEDDAFYECDHLTICAPAGSYAEQFAKENEIGFCQEQ